MAIKKPKIEFPLMLALVGLMLVMPRYSSAQSAPKLKVNDTIPDLVITNLINHSQTDLKPSQLYKSGLLIINFWATWCAPCITEMKALAEEVEKHRGRLNVLNIGYETQAVVRPFLEAHPELSQTGLLITSDDKIWNRLFFHQALPHNIWVDRNGVVKFITGGAEVTSANVDKFLIDSMPKMVQKNEIPFDQFKPMHVEDSLIMYRSIFHKRLPGVSLSGSTIDRYGLGYPNMKQFFSFNSRITHLFFNAYNMQGLASYKSIANLVEVQTTDSSKFFWPGEFAPKGTFKGVSQEEWDRDNTYSYELRTPKRIADSIFFKIVINALEFNLNLKTWLERRRKDCMVVTSPNGTPKISMSTNDQEGFCGIKGNQFLAKNVPLDYVLNWIAKNSYFSPGHRIEPYLNQTGLSGPISIAISLGDDPSQYKSQPFLEKCLGEQLGLKFEMKNEWYPILIIKSL